MRPQALAALLGLALAITAVVFMFSSVTRGGVSCGTAFHDSGKAEVADITTGYVNSSRFGIVGTNVDVQATCDDARSSRATLTLAFGIPGLVLLVGGLASGRKQVIDAPREQVPPAV